MLIASAVILMSGFNDIRGRGNVFVVPNIIMVFDALDLTGLSKQSTRKQACGPFLVHGPVAWMTLI